MHLLQCTRAGSTPPAPLSSRKSRVLLPYRILNTVTFLNGHIHSYYAASAHPDPARPRLQEALECDVCVVGGGIAGCSTALHLAERGYRVVLLEGQRIGWGASGRSGAQALLGVAAGHAKLARMIGESDARRVWDFTVEGLALIRELIAKYRIDCDWVSGHMQWAIK